MRPTTTTAVLATVLALTAAPTSAEAGASAPELARKAVVTVTVPDTLVEGDRFTIDVKVARIRDARRILLQRLTTDVYGATSWETVKRVKVKGLKKHSFGAVAGDADTERYRARVLYSHAKPAMSKPASATVWHWEALTGMADYYQTPGVLEGTAGQINGVRYNGLFTYGAGYSSWEIRFTLGRHCRALRGVLGLGDDSADGSSAAITMVADETAVVLTSGPLSPGMEQRFEVGLALPYRLSVRMQETSPADQVAFPAIGTPEVLCTGLRD